MHLRHAYLLLMVLFVGAALGVAGAFDTACLLVQTAQPFNREQKLTAGWLLPLPLPPAKLCSLSRTVLILLTGKCSVTGQDTLTTGGQWVWNITNRSSDAATIQVLLRGRQGLHVLIRHIYQVPS